MKNILIGAGVIAVLLGGSIWWSKTMQSQDPEIISQSGLHWHPILKVYIGGEEQKIPANVGIGGQYSSLPMGMSPIHTHDDAVDGIIHLEFGGIVRNGDTTLGKFFDSWGKDINSLGANVVMTVNGVANTELGSYQMNDGDKIELRYE
ncbi:MAG: hypothetical protein NUV78_02015 [Candidatus Zambryskibacteria bacterium]|nr:hypothetical protein [Candidatus Zambryskibacteria bacterium]